MAPPPGALGPGPPLRLPVRGALRMLIPEHPAKANGRHGTAPGAFQPTRARGLGRACRGAKHGSIINANLEQNGVALQSAEGCAAARAARGPCLRRHGPVALCGELLPRATRAPHVCAVMLQPPCAARAPAAHAARTRARHAACATHAAAAQPPARRRSLPRRPPPSSRTRTTARACCSRRTPGLAGAGLARQNRAPRYQQQRTGAAPHHPRAAHTLQPPAGRRAHAARRRACGRAPAARAAGDCGAPGGGARRPAAGGGLAV